MIRKVTDPTKIATDPVLLEGLSRQGIDKNYVELWHDYAPLSMGKEYSPSAEFYRDLKSNKRFAVFSGLPMVKPDGTKIEVGWLKQGSKYLSKANLFSALVKGAQITVEGDGKSVTWKPQLFLNGIEQFGGKVALLKTDPTNENYHQNVLEWDYGVCKRRFRIIEGVVREKWIFSEDPRGEVRIKHNHTGKLRLGEFQINDDEELIPREYFAIPEFGYPVEIEASPETFYSTSADGQVRYQGLGGGSYATTHNAETGTDVVNTGDQLNSRNQYLGAGNWYNIYRIFPLFNTVGLPDTCTITGIEFSVYGRFSNETNAGHSDICLYKGNQGDTLVVADYDAFGADLLTTGSYSWGYPLAEGAYTAATLVDVDADNFGYINKTGLTKFCTRLLGDVSNLTPTGDNYGGYWSSEKGVGFYPKLVVTYILPTPVTDGDLIGIGIIRKS